MFVDVRDVMACSWACNFDVCMALNHCGVAEKDLLTLSLFLTPCELRGHKADDRSAPFPVIHSVVIHYHWLMAWLVGYCFVVAMI